MGIRWLMVLFGVACSGAPSVEVTGFDASLVPGAAGVWSDLEGPTGIVDHSWSVHTDEAFDCDAAQTSVDVVTGELAALRDAIDEATDEVAACEAREAYHQARLDAFGLLLEPSLQVSFELIGPDSFQGQLIGAEPVDGAFSTMTDPMEELTLAVSWILWEENPSQVVLDGLDCASAPNVVPTEPEPVVGTGDGTAELVVRGGTALEAVVDVSLLEGKGDSMRGALAGVLRLERCSAQ